jgi:hypothetical protein
MSGKLCTVCSKRHEAQAFLDGYGFKDKALGSHHEVILTLMVRFKAL